MDMCSMKRPASSKAQCLVQELDDGFQLRIIDEGGVGRLRRKKATADTKIESPSPMMPPVTHFKPLRELGFSDPPMWRRGFGDRHLALSIINRTHTKLGEFKNLVASMSFNSSCHGRRWLLGYHGADKVSDEILPSNFPFAV